MPSSKYKFSEPISYDHVITDANGAGKIGELRIKPSSILWKSKGSHKYHSKSLDDFVAWIQANGNEVDK
jgi:hypothetical protein